MHEYNKSACINCRIYSQITRKCNYGIDITRTGSSTRYKVHIKTISLVDLKALFHTRNTRKFPRRIHPLQVQNLYPMRASVLVRLGVTANHGLYVSDAIHRAVVEVNEEGTEAAAVTSMVCHDGASAVKTSQLICDHPVHLLIS